MSEMQVHMIDPATSREYHFSPARDIAYFWPQLIEMAYEGLLEKRWEDWYGDYLRANNVTEKEVMEALVAYSKFCMLSIKTDIKSPAAALEESGFFKTPKAAQLVVCAKFGQLCTGAFWAGIRSATPQGDVPPEIQALVDKGAELERDLSARWSKSEEASDRKTPPRATAGESHPDEHEDGTICEECSPTR